MITLVWMGQYTLVLKGCVCVAKTVCLTSGPFLVTGANLNRSVARVLAWLTSAWITERVPPLQEAKGGGRKDRLGYVSPPHHF